MKSKNDLEKNFIEDLEFAKKTEGSYKQIEAGNFISIDSENIMEEMSKW